MSILEEKNKPYQKLKDIWEHNWSRPDFKPSWIATEIPEVLQKTVAEGWFQPPKSLFDIGCGTGKLANWLAEQGFQVVGCDLSPSVIKQARTNYPAHDNLTFQVTDICQDLAPEPRFELLFDRGCLQGLPKDLYAAYAQVVASWAMPEARFLLICGINQSRQKKDAVTEDSLRSEKTAQLEAVFAPFFNLVKVEPTYLERHPPNKPVPGVAIWFIRKTEIVNEQTNR